MSEYNRDITVKVLSDSLHKRVLIRLKGGKRIRGNLEGFDQHMNLLLSNGEELQDDGSFKQLGSLIIRGDNVIFISPVMD
ncbi:MAG: LSm family protein [Nitrososphaeria archaeon]